MLLKSDINLKKINYIGLKSCSNMFYMHGTCLHKISGTVCMKYLTIISGQMHLLHQFKSDFAHLLALGNLVIELPNAKK